MPLIILVLVCVVAIIYLPDNFKQFLVDMPKRAWLFIWLLGVGLALTHIPILVGLGACIIFAPVLFVIVWLFIEVF